MLTSRRAVLVGSPVVPGRLRLSEDALRFEALAGTTVEVLVAEVRRVALRRRTLVVTTAEDEVRVRCFGVRGVADLLVHACGRVGQD